MFIIEARNEKDWRWISAITRELAAAEAFLASIPDHLSSIQVLIEIPHENYPLFVAEHRGFEYGNADFIRSRLAQIRPSGNEDYVHLNIYEVSEDFTPTHPGEDGMGIIYHRHITDDALVPPRSLAIEKWLREAEQKTEP